MRLHLIITGCVQGVGFRYHTQEKACALHLTGWVKNRADDSVECVAEGKKENLEKFLAWARVGPSLAQVTEVKSHWLEAYGDMTEFKVVS